MTPVKTRGGFHVEICLSAQRKSQAAKDNKLQHGLVETKLLNKIQHFA